jgi:carboxylate-amine ligase
VSRRAWLEQLERGDADPTAALAFLAAQDVDFDDDELRAARRRALLVLAAGGDPQRELEYGSRAVGSVADDLDRPERRAQLLEAADTLGIALAATGTHPWTPWRDVRLIDTPHYRRVAEGLQYVAWRNQTFVLHEHVGIRGADRAIRVCTALREFLPELLALSASSPFHEGVRTGLHSTRTQVFTRAFPRCGVPDPFEAWDEYERYVRFLFETGSIVEHTQIWWSVRPHLAFPTVEIRICDGQPTLGEAQSLAAFIYALTARLARALDEGEPLPQHPHRLIEENLWRAIRFGLSGELIDLTTGDVVPARARLEQLCEWIAPVADELGAAQWLAVPTANAAERQLARVDEGLSLREIYAHEVVAREVVRG